MVEVQAFAYRAPRLSLELPLEFVTASGALRGRSEDLSDTGLLVLLEEPVLTGTQGRVRLRIGALDLEFAAVVAHSELFQAGLSFCFASDRERDFMRTIVRMLVRGRRAL